MFFDAKRKRPAGAVLAGGALIALALGMVNPASASIGGGNFHVKSGYSERVGYYPPVELAVPGESGGSINPTDPPSTSNPGTGATPTPTPNPTTPTPTTPPPAPVESTDMVFTLAAGVGCTAGTRSSFVITNPMTEVRVISPSGVEKKYSARNGLDTVFADELGEWKIVGGYERISFANNKCLTEINDWQGTQVKSAYQTFFNASNLTSIKRIPSQITNMFQMFDGATSFNGDVSEWKTSYVENTTSMFSGATAFQGRGIEKWDVSSLSDARTMFNGAKAFNGDLGSWNVKKLQIASSMFAGTDSFEGKGLDRWQTDSLTKIASMFSSAKKFNANLGSWNVSKVAEFQYAFSSAPLYTGDGIGSWNTSKATDMTRMFDSATSFRGEIGKWPANPNKTTVLTRLLYGASSFDQDLSGWKLCVSTPSSWATGTKIVNDTAKHPSWKGACTA